MVNEISDTIVVQPGGYTKGLIAIKNNRIRFIKAIAIPLFIDLTF